MPGKMPVHPNAWSCLVLSKAVKKLMEQERAMAGAKIHQFVMPQTPAGRDRDRRGEEDGVMGHACCSSPIFPKAAAMSVQPATLFWTLRVRGDVCVL